jgi:hypothetical protein
MVLLGLLFWALLASYVVHILDETLLNGGFVQWIVDNFWPTYTMRMFFWFNAGAIAAIVISNLLFDSLGEHWVILPLIFLAGFAIGTVVGVATVGAFLTVGPTVLAFPRRTGPRHCLSSKIFKPSDSPKQ